MAWGREGERGKVQVGNFWERTNTRYKLVPSEPEKSPIESHEKVKHTVEVINRFHWTLKGLSGYCPPIQAWPPTAPFILLQVPILEGSSFFILPPTPFLRFCLPFYVYFISTTCVSPGCIIPADLTEFLIPSLKNGIFWLRLHYTFFYFESFLE